MSKSKPSKTKAVFQLVDCLNAYTKPPGFRFQYRMVVQVCNSSTQNQEVKANLGYMRLRVRKTKQQR